MNCPSCNRNLAATLSVCPSCGTMVFDSVREELALKISPIAKKPNDAPKEKPIVSVTPVLPTPVLPTPPIEPPAVFTQTSTNKPIELQIDEPVETYEVNNKPVNNIEEMEEIEPPIVKKPQTDRLTVKTTSPTLVEFSNKNAALPEWRLQMQNAVNKRKGRREIPSEPIKPQTVSKPARTGTSTNGATALKVQPEEKPAPSTENLTALERALLRIEESRQKYISEEIEQKTQLDSSQSSVKYFPTVSQNRSQQEFSPKVGQSQTIAKFTAKPNISSINELKPAKKFDTNKLPPLPAKISSSFENQNRQIINTNLDLDIEDEDFIRNAVDNDAPEVSAYNQTAAIETQNDEDIDDCAPLSLRFNAAIFDLLIGSFLSLLLLSPFMLLNGKFFSTEGLLAFLGTCAIVMFVYMTASIGFLGRTFGMKLFSLEIVDIDENAYPTIHQAAVSSSLYLVSLALGGLGFLTLLVNNEKRAAHDLLSGTIIVKEY